jgi:hypothetical protein
MLAALLLLNFCVFAAPISIRFCIIFCEFFQTMVGDSIANINMYSSDEEPSIPQEENPLLKSDTHYDQRYLSCQLFVG